DRWVERLPLGPSLGQCCGGMAHLLFERLCAEDRTWIDALRQRLLAGQAVTRHVSLAPGAQPPVRLADAGPIDSSDHTPDKLLARDEQGEVFYAERLAPAAQHIVLFGAGHVGQALVHILGTLPCRVVW